MGGGQQRSFSGCVAGPMCSLSLAVYRQPDALKVGSSVTCRVMYLGSLHRRYSAAVARPSYK